MLSLQNDGRYLALDLTPQQRRHKTLEALTTQLEALTLQRPVVQIFEDAHWADPTSLEVFGRVAAGCREVDTDRLELSRLEPTRYHKITHNPVAIRELLVEVFPAAGLGR